jgi:hypothetical protein
MTSANSKPKVAIDRDKLQKAMAMLVNNPPSDAYAAAEAMFALLSEE